MLKISVILMEVEEPEDKNTLREGEGKRGLTSSLVVTINKMAHFFGVLIFIYTVYLAKPGFSELDSLFDLRAITRF